MTTTVVGSTSEGLTQYVESVAELEALSLEAGVNVYLTQAGRSGEFVVKAGAPPSDPLQGVYIVLANGNYAERIDFDVYTPEMFGISGAGIETTEINQFFEFVPEGSSVRIDADHEVDSQILIEKTLRVSGKGKVFCNDYTPPVTSEDDRALILVTGQEADSAVSTITSLPVEEDTNEITLASVSGLSPGDLIYIESDAIINNGRVTSFKRQHAEIDSISGNTITLRQPIVYSFNTGETVSVYKHSYVDGFVWGGVGVEQQTNNAELTKGLVLNLCKNSRIENCKVKEGTLSATQIRKSYNTHIYNIVSGLTTEPANGLEYGILIALSSYCSASFSTAYSKRTAIDISESDNCKSKRCAVYGSLSTHTGSGHSFESMSVLGGTLVRSQKTSFESCKLTREDLANNGNEGVLWSSEAGLNGGITVIGCDITLANSADTATNILYLPGPPVGDPSYSNKIQNNRLITKSASAGTIVLGSTAGANYGVVTVFTDNVVQGFDGSLVTISRTSGFTASGNRIYAIGGNGFLCYDSGGFTSRDISITGNSFTFSGTGGRTVSFGGVDASLIEKVIFTGNVSRGDTRSASFGAIPTAQYLNTDNLTDA